MVEVRSVVAFVSLSFFPHRTVIVQTRCLSYAAVGGGYLNRASGRFAHIPGGAKNTASGRYSYGSGFKTSSSTCCRLLPKHVYSTFLVLNCLVVTCLRLGTSGDYSATFGYYSGGCETRGDETITFCAEVVDIQATLLLNGDELTTGRRLREETVSFQFKRRLAQSNVDDVLLNCSI